MHTQKLIIQELLKQKEISSLALSDAKRKIAKENKTNCPTNSSILKVYHSLIENKSIKPNKKLEQTLKTRPIRSLSGIVNVSILSKPFECPGKCTFCPNEKDIPKSYLSGEPAVERAKRLKYDPYIQTQKRIEILENNGHNAEKIDLRIIGGTWSSYSLKYRIWFIKRCFDACNEKPYKKESFSTKSINELWKELEKSQKINETAKYRMIGLSFETRPDYINEEETYILRKLGGTKIELGIQSIYDDVLKHTKRGHDINTTINATKILRNAGFKIAYQVMLNLPKSNKKRDFEMFKTLFSNKDFKPDYLKIYPCALVKNSELYKEYEKGEYKPYTEKELINLIKKIKTVIPYYVRVERVIRDIPAPLIVEGGAKTSNLRQIIEREMKKENIECKCIRCREIKDLKQDKDVQIFKEEYEAADGKEIFLSFEDKKRKNIYSMLRLRLLKNKTLIRELHTYGTAEKIKEKGNVQHKGLGKALLKEAEKISKNKIYIISGVGVREYYKKQEYKLENYYMVKNV
jgi:elongator complex protein 3